MAMDYRKFSNTVKGMYIRWGGNIFPDYRDVSGPNVSHKRLQRAKPIVVLILQQEEKRITQAFVEFCKGRYRGQNRVVTLDFKAAIERVKDAKLQPDNEERYGESDGFTIWIARMKMSDEELVGTLLHEALHCIAIIDNKEICAKDEHQVIRELGDQC
eukprot:TRINITY_DN9295_c0_g1_i2.p1 TRINITY_DN9295_c0_g1~~TRINITY_DN9295_c0_g1_i2.p1  ORF type:complete len:158 (+),score=38.03 TRINITY_DN9295_c0_g1_i2:109-582(+)